MTVSSNTTTARSRSINAAASLSPPSSTSSSRDTSLDGDGLSAAPAHQQRHRPDLGSRKPSGTIIVAREHPRVELKEGEEEFGEDDARAMSPRRNSEDLEKMSRDARTQLDEHAKHLQKSLLDIFNRIEAVKEEHDKLDNNNKFLQKYIGDLMSTSKITSTGGNGRKT